MALVRKSKSFLGAMARMSPGIVFGVKVPHLVQLVPCKIDSDGDLQPALEESKLVLLLSTLQKPVRQCYLRCKHEAASISDQIIPGSFVQLLLRREELSDTVAMAMWLRKHFSTIRVLQYGYRFCGLDSVWIVDKQDVTDVIRRLMIITQGDQEISMIKKLLGEKRKRVREYSNKEKARRLGGAAAGMGKGKGKGRGKGRGKGEPDGDPEVVAPDAAEDAHESDDSATSSGADFADTVRDEDNFWDVRAEWVLAEAEAARLIDIEYKGRLNNTIVFVVRATKQKVGEASVMHVGLPRESMNLKCFLHDCKMSKYTRRFPSAEDLRDSFEASYRDYKACTAANKARHLRGLNELVAVRDAENAQRISAAGDAE